MYGSQIYPPTFVGSIPDPLLIRFQTNKILGTVERANHGTTLLSLYERKNSVHLLSHYTRTLFATAPFGRP